MKYQYIFILIVSIFLFGCVQMESQETNQKSNSPSGSGFTSKKKIFSPGSIITHDFTKRVNISISEGVANNPNLSHIILENEDGSFRMIVDREDLAFKSDFSVPISRLGEQIEPKLIFK